MIQGLRIWSFLGLGVEAREVQGLRVWGSGLQGFSRVEAPVIVGPWESKT